jgi:hypothetical protein
VDGIAGGWLISRDAFFGIRDDKLLIIDVFGRMLLGLDDVYFLENVGLRGRRMYLCILRGRSLSLGMGCVFVGLLFCSLLGRDDFAIMLLFVESTLESCRLYDTCGEISGGAVFSTWLVRVEVNNTSTDDSTCRATSRASSSTEIANGFIDIGLSAIGTR